MKLHLLAEKISEAPSLSLLQAGNQAVISVSVFTRDVHILGMTLPRRLFLTFGPRVAAMGKAFVCGLTSLAAAVTR